MSAMLPRILLVEPQFVLRRTMVMVARDLGMAVSYTHLTLPTILLV